MKFNTFILKILTYLQSANTVILATAASISLFYKIALIWDNLQIKLPILNI